MSTKFIIGLDLARMTPHKAVITGPDHQPVGRPRKVTSTASSLDELIAAAGSQEQPPDVVMEPTGLLWFPVSAFLEARGCRVTRVNTRDSSEYRKVISRSVKSDAIDALALARLPMANPGLAAPVKVPSKGHFALQRLLHQRAQLVDDRTRQRLRLVAELEAYVPALPAIVSTGSGESEAKSLLLRRFLDPRLVKAAGTAGMQAALDEAGIVVSDPDLLARWLEAAELAVKLWGSAEVDGGWPVDMEVASHVVTRYLDIIDVLDEQITSAEVEIATLYATCQASEALATIPGVGPVVGPAIVAAIGDISRFKSAKHLVSYCGLAPRKHQTGLTDRKGQPISKSGNRHLRRYLFLAADVARHIDPDFGAYYFRETAKGRHHTHIVTALAAKLARRVYAVLKRLSQRNSDSSYVLRDPDGKVLSRREARAFTSTHFPSKAAQRRAEAERRAQGAATRKTGQSKDSPQDDRTPGTSTPTPGASKTQPASEADSHRQPS